MAWVERNVHLQPSKGPKEIEKKHTKLHLLVINLVWHNSLQGSYERLSMRYRAGQRQMSKEKQQALMKWYHPSVQYKQQKERKGRQPCTIPFRDRIEGGGHTPRKEKASLVQAVIQRSTNTLLSTMLHLTCTNKDLLRSLQGLTQLESALVSVCSTSLCHTGLPWI